jgi:hypothetical protein
MRTAGIVISFCLLLVGLVILTIGIMGESAGMNILGAPMFLVRVIVFFGSPGGAQVAGLIIALVGFFLRLWLHFTPKVEAK